MPPSRPMTRMNREYARQLRHLRELLIRMAGRVEEMIADSIKALVDADPELAARTIAKDNRVNRAELETDEACLVILAKWQPLASDLRFVTLIMKMVTDLERIGDLAVNICERAIELSKSPPLISYVSIERMAAIVQSLIRDAIDAFVNLDADLAHEVVERDDQVDDLYHRIFREILGIMVRDTAAVERGIHVQSVVKWLERMGDHGTNLAEQVIFMVRGKDIRHEGKLPSH